MKVYVNIKTRKLTKRMDIIFRNGKEVIVYSWIPYKVFVIRVNKKLESLEFEGDINERFEKLFKHLEKYVSKKDIEKARKKVKAIIIKLLDQTFSSELLQKNLIHQKSLSNSQFHILLNLFLLISQNKL